MTEPPIDQLVALVRGVRNGITALPREELRSADPAGELTILVGALERMVGKLEDRLGQLGQGDALTAEGAPSLTSTPTAPSSESHDALSDVQAPSKRSRLSPPGMVAFDLLQDGASEEQISAYLERHFGSSDAAEVLAEVDEWVHRGRRS